MQYGENNFGQGAISGELGSGLYDFATQTANLPTAEAASTASQVESGGTGFNWNQALADITGAWVKVEGQSSSWPGAPVQYRKGEDGRLYTTDGKLVQSPAAGPQKIGLEKLLLWGGLLFVVLKVAK